MVAAAIRIESPILPTASEKVIVVTVVTGVVTGRFRGVFQDIPKNGKPGKVPILGHFYTLRYFEITTENRQKRGLEITWGAIQSKSEPEADRRWVRICCLSQHF